MTIFDLLKSPHYPKKPILEKMLCHKLWLSKEQLFTHMDNEIDPTDFERIQNAYHDYTVHKKPVEYILGYVTFSGLQFNVTPDTIIPRPETEYMIEAVREFLEISDSDKRNQGGDWKSKQYTLLDIGTGSGILGLATLYHCGHHIKQAYLCDLSEQALDVAQWNQKKIVPTINDTKEVCRFLHCSLLDHPELKACFSSKQSDTHPVKGDVTQWQGVLLVANLPYIPDELFANNADESITKREPTMAFVGGDDGLDLYRIMFDQLLVLGNKNVTMFLEMMTRQGKILAEAYKEYFHFEEIKTFHGNIRILKASCIQ